MDIENYCFLNNDYAFKSVFAVETGAERRLKILICEVLNLKPEEIEELSIVNGEFTPIDKIGRGVRLDVHAVIKLHGNEELIDIEMQRIVGSDVFDRALFYWSAIHRHSLKI